MLEYDSGMVLCIYFEASTSESEIERHREPMDPSITCILCYALVLNSNITYPPIQCTLSTRPFTPT